MIVEKNFLSKLKEFGLNSYESKLWTALLSRGVSTAGELSDIANVPRSRSYDVLESLEKKGFVIMKLGKPIKYIAVPPAEVIERVKKKIKREAEQREKHLDELNQSELLDELDILYKQGIDTVEPTELAGSIKGRENIYNQMSSMIKKAEESIKIISTEKGIKRKVKNLNRLLKKAQKRGVKVVVSGPVSEENKKLIEKIEKIGEFRKTTQKKARIIIIDDRELMFMLTNDEKVHPSYDVGVWINSPYFTETMVSALNI
jgi:sugar-specific transcriptional regulator TrmB